VGSPAAKVISSTVVFAGTAIEAWSATSVAERSPWSRWDAWASTSADTTIWASVSRLTTPSTVRSDVGAAPGSPVEVTSTAAVDSYDGASEVWSHHPAARNRATRRTRVRAPRRSARP
jgi:hypothetical protein